MAFISLGRADYSGITVGKKWTLKIFAPQTYYKSFDVTSVTIVAVMADVYDDGEKTGNVNIGETYVFDGTIISVFVGEYGTSTANYGGQSLTVCDTGLIVFDTATGIYLECDNVFEFHSWSLYSTRGGSGIPGYSWVLILLAIIGTSFYLMKKRFKNS